MLQILIWICCTMLVVKALEISGRERWTIGNVLAAVVAIIAAVIFVLMANKQVEQTTGSLGSVMPSSFDPNSTNLADNLDAAAAKLGQNAEAVAADTDNAISEADNALDAADKSGNSSRQR